ncbi:class IV adenylate cyclase [Candidatus Methanodesulfokora washburnensis]|uniref:CYTH domain-containing protein n=1 Tax=Candidatus Methanodesulfokora washburnensis TaxID=2478471 RepID=A0A3R9PHB9_9CREN|nr:class IV adenylate cyclase [Candidatus Methanodesulfokores washburnensis]RSN73552.1 CYTH domain-containing protein [Candidatus Methanodesulfokores washburnensis]
MAVEKEIKVKMPHDEFVGMLKSRGVNFSFIKEICQVDLILDYDDMRLLKEDSLLRIRKENESLFITYKGPRRLGNVYKEREEIEGELGSEESVLALKMAGIYLNEDIRDEKALIEFLSSRGIKIRAVVEKHRIVMRVYPWKSLIFLDDVKGLGEYIEIEGDDCQEVAKFLNLKNFVKESYAELILRESSLHQLSLGDP